VHVEQEAGDHDDARGDDETCSDHACDYVVACCDSDDAGACRVNSGARGDNHDEARNNDHIANDHIARDDVACDWVACGDNDDARGHDYGASYRDDRDASKHYVASCDDDACRYEYFACDCVARDHVVVDCRDSDDAGARDRVACDRVACDDVVS